MLNTTELKKQAKLLGTELKSKGYPVPHSVLLHVLSALQGNSNWHVALAKESKSVTPAQPVVFEGIPVFNRQQPFTRLELFQQLAAANGNHISHIVSVPADLMGDIEALNDFVSEKLAGNYALMDIGYEVKSGLKVAADEIAVAVHVGDVDFDCFDESDDEWIPCQFISNWEMSGPIVTDCQVNLISGEVRNISMYEGDLLNDDILKNEQISYNSISALVTANNDTYFIENTAELEAWQYAVLGSFFPTSVQE